jgi:2-polyprenyl-6-methoxyphenol hydroxylase-like FAD-dependent oxidoreductase
MKRENIFVIIVGGGPVGLSAAIELGHRNVPAILVTENLETAKHPRCNNTNARSMEHFRRLGISEEIRANAPLAKYPPQVAFVTRFCGHEIGRIDLTKSRSTTNLPGTEFQSAERNIAISQLFLEPILKRNAESKKSVSIRFGFRMIGFVSTPEGVLVDIENIQTGERSQISASYMIAADGARSPARRHFGIGMTGEDGQMENAFVAGSMLTYFIRAPSLMAESRRKPANLTWILNHEIRAFVFSQDGGERWIVHYKIPEGVDWKKVHHEKVLNAVFGKPVPFEIISCGPWAGGLALVADQYQAERVFFVGDAAHLFTPLGGFGMNTGIGDAINVSWKLAAMFEGWGGPSLLDTYGAERRPIGLRNSRLGVKCSKRKGAWQLPPNIEDADEAGEQARLAFGEFAVVDDLEEYNTSGMQFGERYEKSPIIFHQGEAQIADIWDNYVPIDHPGARVPDFKITETETFHDQLGDSYSLAIFTNDVDAKPFVDAAANRGVPLQIVKCTPPAHLYQCKLALIRPDRHLAWHGYAMPVNTLEIIDRLRGA